MAQVRPSGLLARLEVSVSFGLVAGFVYTLLDGYLDHTFGAPLSAPARPIEVLHTILDFVLPTITGGLFGVAVHYVRLRAKMAELERQRADNLSFDLHKIERDQAVWVISASLLHELKNPVHALGLLLDEALETSRHDAEQQTRLLSRARAQVERIASELATLRALPGSARPDLPHIELTEVVESVVSAFVQRAPQIDVQWLHASREPMWVRANPAYVRIILENLLENSNDALAELAVSAPRVRVDVVLHEGRSAIEVVDNGPGIDPDMRERLFEPLQSTKASGMGLGLAIARTLARAMGGDLVLSNTAQGAGFRLILEKGEPSS